MRSFPFFLAVISSVLLSDLRASGFASSFVNPPREHLPLIRWWWNGGKIEKEEITRQLDVLHRGGIGGVEINTVAIADGVSKSEAEQYPTVEWLSPEWCEMVKFTGIEAAKRGMSVDVLVGSGWPFGGKFVEVSEQSQRIRLAKIDLHGPIRVSYTTADLIALPSAKKQYEDPVPPTHSEIAFLRIVESEMPSGSFNVGQEIGTTPFQNDSVEIDVPKGDFTLYVGIREVGFTHVKLGAPGADGPVVDHFNERAVRRYLNRLSESLVAAFHGEIRKYIRAFFIDSLELDRANWTTDFGTQFLARRGYDIAPYLPFVLDEGGSFNGSAKEIIEGARYDFCLTLTELFSERFLQNYRNWAQENGVRARIQAYGREVDPLDGSLTADLPEGETWLWVDKSDPLRIRSEPTVVNRYVSSASDIAGTSTRSFEALTNTVPVFRETLQNFKIGLDSTYLIGLNQPIFHGYSYSPAKAGFPGWVRYGSYLNEKNPLWKHFESLSLYAARIGLVLKESETLSSVAMLPPRADEWSEHGLLYQPFPEIREPWYQYELADSLQRCGVQTTYINESVLAKAEVKNGVLKCGRMQFHTLVLPDVQTIGVNGIAKITQFVGTGGQLIVIGKTPSRAPGLLSIGERSSHVKEVFATLLGRFDDVTLMSAPEKEAKGGIDPIEVLRSYALEVSEKIRHRGPVTLTKPSVIASIRCAKMDDSIVLFAANKSETQTASLEIQLNERHDFVYSLDPRTGSITQVNAPASMLFRLLVGKAGSGILIFSKENNFLKTAIPQKQTSEVTSRLVDLKLEWNLSLNDVVNPASVLNLSMLSDLSQNRDVSVAGFAGEIIYEAEFTTQKSNEKIYINLGEVTGVSTLKLNGFPVGQRLWGDHRYDISKQVRNGVNRLQVKVDTTLINKVRLMSQNSTAIRWATWAPPIPMGLLGPVKLSFSSSLPEPNCSDLSYIAEIRMPEEDF